MRGQGMVVTLFRAVRPLGRELRMQRRVLRRRGGLTTAAALVLLGLVALVGGSQRASAQPAAAARIGVPAQHVAPAAQPAATPKGKPIVVGSTLSLTGSFGATGIIHKAAGEAYIRWINANGGGLGGPGPGEPYHDEAGAAKGEQP